MTGASIRRRLARCGVDFGLHGDRRELVLSSAVGRDLSRCAGASRSGWFFASLCTATSVAGGLLGYFIGAELYATVGQWLIGLYGYGDRVEAFREAYAHYGAWIILLKGLTPIPYKIVTITSGFAGFSIGLFIVMSIISRGMRFYLIAFLLNRYGDRARGIIREAAGACGQRLAPSFL